MRMRFHIQCFARFQESRSHAIEKDERPDQPSLPARQCPAHRKSADIAGARNDQILDGIAGERRLTEWEAPWLAGYRQSSPVRIGNAAHAQLQLDVYGEVMDTLHQGRRGGLPDFEAGWEVQRVLLQNLEQVWREPDSGRRDIDAQRSSLDEIERSVLSDHGTSKARPARPNVLSLW